MSTARPLATKPHPPFRLSPRDLASITTQALATVEPHLTPLRRFATAVHHLTLADHATSEAIPDAQLRSTLAIGDRRTRERWETSR